MLFLDAGALLFKQPLVAGGREAAQARAAARGIVEAYNWMGVTAVGVTRYDLAGGVAFLQSLAKVARFPWLCADLVDDNGAPLFPPSLVTAAGGIRIGIIGISGLEAAPAGTRLRPWSSFLPELAANLGQRCDLLILLSGLPYAENHTIAQRIPAIHLILQAGTSLSRLGPELVNNTLITQSPGRGKHLGLLRINWCPAGHWGEPPRQKLSRLNGELDRLSWLLRRYRLRQRQPANEQDRQRLAAMNHRRKTLIREIARLRQEQTGAKERSDCWYQASFPAVPTSLPEEPKVQALVRDTFARMNTLGREAGENRKERPAGYLGWPACQNCHQDQTRSWRRTPHARAYQTLVKAGQQYNLGCLPCHLTGISRKRPEAALTIPAELRQVGCEACHGPGQAHAAQPEQQRLPGTPGPAVCLGCHSPEHDSSFRYDRKRSLVHPRSAPFRNKTEPPLNAPTPGKLLQAPGR